MKIRDINENYSYQYEMNSATSTVFMFVGDHVVAGLRQRSAEAFPNTWCMPGGFIEVGKETLEDCAIRETKEETNIDLSHEQIRQFYTHSDPKTDPRNHVINACFIAEIDEAQWKTARAGDDLSELDLVPLNDLERRWAFNHLELLNRAIRAR